MKQYILLLFLILTSFAHANSYHKTIDDGGPKTTIPTVHVISIGINKLKNVDYIKYAVSDSKILIEKIKNDSLIEDPNWDSRMSGNPKKLKLKFNIYNLTNETASVTEIRKALKEIIIKADINDYFIFYYGGFSFSNDKGVFLKTIHSDITAYVTDNEIPLNELAQFFEQIKCNNQLIICEAGSGKEFSQDLIKNMFESNALISENTSRNRIIMTTNELGYESDKIGGGYLIYYLRNENIKILDIFDDFDAFDFAIAKIEIQEAAREEYIKQDYTKRRYTKIYSENEFKKILTNSATISRGATKINTNSEDKKDKNTTSQTHALLIATNNYNSSQEWNTLKNPINDANSVAEILGGKYNVTVSKQYNKTYREILEEIVRIKNVMNENDKFIFFVAGHGYYSDNLSDGFLVLQDSRETTDDFGLNSYLSMATLQRLLDNMPSKNVFAIFDVCFGLTFDPLSKDVALSNLKNISKDISLDEFIARKNENYSRIFLASGQYEVPDYWKTSLTHSPFADKLIKSLNAETDFTNPSKIYSALEGNITQPFLKQFGKHDERGDFLLKVE